MPGMPVIALSRVFYPEQVQRESIAYIMRVAVHNPQT